MRPWLIMLCPYFGRWPEWMNFFVESCKWNPGVRWRFYTDCGEPENRAGNVDYIHVAFDRYKTHVRERLSVAFDPPDPYKLCDLKPCLGFLHESDTADFPFFGYGDIDVIYGRIGDFYGEEAFAQYDIVSSHREMLSNHFAVFRNTPDCRHAFFHIQNYRTILESPRHWASDDVQFSKLFLDSADARHLFIERHSTVLSPRGWHDGTMNYPQRWFWRDGRLTNDRDGAREFLYLHFMRWKSARWINNPPLPGESAWAGQDIVHIDWRSAATDGFCIGRDGFTPLAASANAVFPVQPSGDFADHG